VKLADALCKLSVVMASDFHAAIADDHAGMLHSILGEAVADMDVEAAAAADGSGSIGVLDEAQSTEKTKSCEDVAALVKTA
jgi:hypothetical protein